MPAPASQPTWATDTNFTNGGAGIAGTNTKVAPSAGIQAEGHVPGTKAPAQRLNWWMNLVGQWTTWLEAERARIAAIVDPPSTLKVINISGVAFQSQWDTGGSRLAWEPDPTSGRYRISQAATSKCFLDLNTILPHEAQVQRVQALVNPAVGGRASGNRMEMRILRVDRSAVAVPTATVEVARTGATVNVATMEDDDTGNVQELDTGALVSPLELDRGVESLVVEIRSSNSANSDFLYGVEIVAILPSVRNF